MHSQYMHLKNTRQVIMHSYMH